jgi:DNA-binding CsgD family transcriptional regulator
METQMLNDQEYLSRYIDSVSFILENDSAPIVFIKDNDFVYRLVSKGFENLDEEDEFKNVLGKTDFEIQDLLERPDWGKYIRAQDMKVKDSGIRHFFLHVTAGKNMYIVRKHPIINPHTGNFIGIHGQMSTFIFPHPLKIIYRINQVESSIISEADEFIPQYDLTERQHMVLFLYLNRYSYSEIADILTNLGYKISAGRVNDHLENLKYIFGAKSKETLLEKALSLNYHLFIPRKFLKVGSYDIDDKIVISNI